MLSEQDEGVKQNEIVDPILVRGSDGRPQELRIRARRFRDRTLFVKFYTFRRATRHHTETVGILSLFDKSHGTGRVFCISHPDQPETPAAADSGRIPAERMAQYPTAQSGTVNRT
jgi:hypothetical protein